MVASRRKLLVRCAVATVAVVLMVIATSSPSSADSEGYSDNFSGDVTSTLSTWNQANAQWQLLFSQTDPASIRSSFDTAWTGLHDQFCTLLEAGIKQGDGDWVKRNRCDPVTADHAELRVKNLGTNVVGLRYFIPGHDGVEYAYDHDSFFGDVNIDVSFDLTIDVVLRFAPGVVGAESDSATPTSVQSARLSFSNSYVRATVCTDSCAQAEKTINSTVVDVSSMIDVTGNNSQIHAQLPAGAYGLAATSNPSVVAVDFRLDVIPAFDGQRRLAAQAFTTPFFGVQLPVVALLGVDTGGRLWQQTGAFGVWNHWYNYSTPPGTTAASGPASVVGRDGQPHVFVTGANGHVFEHVGAKWFDRGQPANTTAVGTPAATMLDGTLANVVVRGANGNLELLRETTPGTWQWHHLGNSGVVTAFDPAIASIGGDVAVVVTRPDGRLVTRENRGNGWAAWRDLGALPSPATTAPSMIASGGAYSAFVTGVSQEVEQVTFAPGGAASAFAWQALFPFVALPAISSAPAATVLANGRASVFGIDTFGNLVQFQESQSRKGGFPYSVSFGTLLGTSMGAPAALANAASPSAFSIASDGHVGETHVSGTRSGLVDHSARTRVLTQAHGSFGRRQLWGATAGEGQTAIGSGPGPFGVLGLLDAFRVQSTLGGTVLCQAYAQGVGWLPEVTDGQTCGTIGQGHGIGAVRLRLADGAPAAHVIYRCNVAGAWTPWLADGTACGATDVFPPIQPVTALQVQLADAAPPTVTYRTKPGDSGWRAWVDDGTVAGASALEAVEVHSDVGGSLTCQAYVSEATDAPTAPEWLPPVDDSGLCGNVTEEGRRLQVIKLQLVGAPFGEHVSYRVYVSGLGWQPWVYDGGLTGVGLPGRAIEQIQVVFTHSTVFTN